MRLFVLTAIIMMTAATSMAQKGNRQLDVAKNLDIFNTIYRNLELMYVDTLDANQVVGTAIQAMLHSLDPYTEYYAEENMGELKELYTGKFAGIGALIRYNAQLKRVVIEEPYAGMPADEVGLKKGDVILSIDDSLMTDKSVSYVSEHLRGDPGTTFVLKIQRPSTGKKMQMKITRRTIQMPSVTYYGLLPDSIGYLGLRQYTEGCSKDVRRAFIEMKDRGMRGFVLDLRGNGGGAEAEAVEIVNMFVPQGELIVSNRGKLARANRDYHTKVEPIDTIMPVVVLVNDNTASASEITAGALQDLDRAVILGTRTYGKGLVQMSVELPYNGSLKLTSNKYYIPSGRCIQAINYKHGKTSSAEHIPDSLTHVFYTRAGREVRDGGGITPDVVLKSDSLPNIAYYLASSGLDSTEVLHNYVVDYVARHPQVAPPSQFTLSDADYELFKKKVMESGFSYDPETAKYLEQLIKLARFEGYYDEAKADFDNLQSKLKHNLAHDLDYHRPQIQRIIETELMTAYYHQAGAVENSLRSDKQMTEARRLLLAPDEYKSLLRPKNIAKE